MSKIALQVILAALLFLSATLLWEHYMAVVSAVGMLAVLYTALGSDRKAWRALRFIDWCFLVVYWVLLAGS